MDGFVLSEEEGEQINFRGTRMLIKVSNDDSEGRYSLIEMTHQPNMGPALHIHPHSPEAYYVLEGEYSIQYNTIIGYIRQKQEILYLFQKVIHINISLAQTVEKCLLSHLQG